MLVLVLVLGLVLMLCCVVKKNSLAVYATSNLVDLVVVEGFLAQDDVDGLAHVCLVCAPAEDRRGDALDTKALGHETVDDLLRRPVVLDGRPNDALAVYAPCQIHFRESVDLRSAARRTYLLSP